jgi:hypothetical protein
VYLVVDDLGLQLLDAVGGEGPVLDHPVGLLDESLELPHLLLILLILHHRLLGEEHPPHPDGAPT